MENKNGVFKGNSAGTDGGKAVMMRKICKFPKPNPETVNTGPLRVKS